MSDLISRQAVENITWEEPSYSDPLNVLTEIREKVRALPSVENKGEWIPVFERLPEDYDRVLITINGCRGLIVREAEYHKAQNEFEVLHNHERWEIGEKGLLAWQPLPEPYKAESED